MTSELGLDWDLNWEANPDLKLLPHHPNFSLTKKKWN